MARPDLVLRLWRVLVAPTDVDRWRRVADQTAGWDERNVMIARLVPAGRSVLDLGAGKQTLRSYLQPGSEYQPCDLILHSPDTLLCDFNAGKYPLLTKRYDYVVCSGVLEYIRDPRKFLQTVTTFGAQTIISYAPRIAGETKLSRWSQGWVNHLRQSELEDLFSSLGLGWSVVGRWQQQLIYRIHPSSVEEIARG